MSAPAALPAERRHELILASAGSGKTWQLSNRVLRLLLEGVPPERILATTFTRKAAGEILSRVLSRLADAAASDAGLEDLREALADAEAGAAPGGAPLDRARCRELLAHLVRRLDRFQVRTLDSFFSELARRYGHELGLPPGWTLVDDSDETALCQDAVSAMLDPGRGPALGEIVRALHGEAAERSVHEKLMESVRQGHAIWLDAEPGAWERLRPPAGLPPADLAALIERLCALEAPRAKSTGKPLSSWEGARDKVVAAAVEEHWEDLAKQTLLKNALTKEPRYGSAPIEGAWLEALTALARHVAHAAGTHLLRRGRAWCELLERFHACYEALQAERRSYRFDDLPRRLADGLSSALADGGAFFRLHGRVDHLLLDEFQDTSVLQWRVLRPLAESILSGPAGRRSFFCVGDVKQAIYAWREGEARLLSGLPDAYPQLEEGTRTLARSWRSSDVVLRTVNAVFARLGESPVFADEPVLAEAAAAWSARFETHTAANALPGAARLLEVPTGPGNAATRRRAMMDSTAKHVATLVRQAPHASIAVLLRKGAGSARLLRALADEGVHASGERGNPLVDAASVRLALSALHLADHPADEAALLHLADSPLAGALGLSRDVLDALGTRGRPHPDPAAAESAARTREELLSLGYGGWLARLERAVRVQPAFDAWERGRFGQLVALGLRWDARATLRPSDFVTWVRATRVDHPSAAGVRVMTVHAAKGLEFDAVVLPDLDDKLAGPSPALLAVRERPEGGFTSVMPWPGKALLPLLDEARAADAAYQARGLEETLCVLYVAMTRARHRLDLLVQPPDVKPAVRRSFARLLRHALGETGAPAGGDAAGDAAPDGPVELWRQPGSVDRWWSEPDEVPSMPRGAPRRPLVLDTGSAPRRPVREAPSMLGGARTVRAEELLSDDGGAARARGSVIHGWLAEIEWLDGFDPAARREELLGRGVRLARALGADADAVPRWFDEWLGWLGRPATRELLDRSSCTLHGRADGAPEVWRERAFAVCLPREGGGAPERLLTGSFDRVVLARRDGKAVAAEITDYKTDAVPDGSALAARVAHHRPQMEAYRAALVALTGLAPEHVACRLLFLSRDLVVDV